MTHHCPGFPGIARYPVDAWEEAGAPMFTVKSWAKLAMKVAVKDMTNLAGVFELAKKLEAKHVAPEPANAFQEEAPQG